MDKMNYVQLILTVNGCLLLLVGYFVNRLVGKVDETAKAIVSLDRNVAVIAEQIKQHESRIAVIEDMEKQLRRDFSKDVHKIREKLHEHGNRFGEMTLFMENCKNNCNYKE